MSKDNVKSLPISKTTRRRDQIEQDRLEASMKRTDTRNSIIFIGVVIGVLALGLTLIYSISLIPESVYAVMGVTK